MTRYLVYVAPPFGLEGVVHTVRREGVNHNLFTQAEAHIVATDLRVAYPTLHVHVVAVELPDDPV